MTTKSKKSKKTEADPIVTDEDTTPAKDVVDSADLADPGDTRATEAATNPEAAPVQPATTGSSDSVRSTTTEPEEERESVPNPAMAYQEALAKGSVHLPRADK